MNELTNFFSFSWEYWYVFPYAVFVAVFANASGFSGAVLFQPFFNFVLQLPMAQSIATGIATETIGMTSGATRYAIMRKIDWMAVRVLLPAVLIGAVCGLVLFSRVSAPVLRLTVGLVVGSIALTQLVRAARNILGSRDHADLHALKGKRLTSAFSGAFSACTGTGVAEMTQPVLESDGGMKVHRANGTAIVLEACADWVITAANLSMGNLRLDILVFSASGVLIGAQIGAHWSPRISGRILKYSFSLCVLGVSVVYIYMGTMQLLQL